ncbi:MAG TPA: AI-2E family transporter [Thermoanaerobaculia bacterium]|jgi:predicted PurR-regulated permease PerM|nr:AI-2E family transporter [Thermoanaerobaculia bacterium]
MALYPRPVERPRSELELFTRKLLIVVGVAALAALLWFARDALLLVFIAAVLAAGIAPAVRRVRILWRYHFRRKLSRGTAVMVVYLPFLVAVLLTCILVVPRFVHDTRELGQKLPALVDRNILTPLEGYGVPVSVIREELSTAEMPRSRVFAYMRNAAAAVASMFAVLFMVAYMLIDAERLRNLFLLVYPPEVRGRRRRALMRIAKRMSGWLSAQLLLSAIIGISTFVGLVLLRIPYALPLSIIAAIGELIPVIGPTVGAIPALVIALLHSRWQFWSVLAFAFLLQKVENYLIVPRVMSAKVSISPLAVFIAFLVGASLLGMIGAIMAIPAAAITQVAFDEAFVKRRERRQDQDRAGTLLRKAD